jgi:uncharacterized SAM-dependent methyltransferase
MNPSILPAAQGSAPSTAEDLAAARRPVAESAAVSLHAAPEGWTGLAADVLQGLTSTPKTLPPKWFYDARGSLLFDAICELPEYYPTRREAALLAVINRELHAFLLAVRGLLRPGDALLVGHDLVKDPAIIVPAYDDAQGVTAAFNRNVLAVINRELHADFDLDAFAHEATWNAALQRVEIRLRSRHAHVVRVASLGLDVAFRAGESILTEISRKFRRDGIALVAERAGMRLRAWHQDHDGWYGVSLLTPGALPA